VRRRRRAGECRRLDPVTLEVVEVVKGRSFEPSSAKFLRRVMAPKLAAALAQARFREVAATPATIPDNACQRAPEEPA
jgi:hypothetical protein